MIKKSLFWEIYHPEEEAKKSALFGTIHLSTDQVFQFTNRLTTLIEHYEAVFTETSLDQKDNQYLNNHIFVEDGSWNTYLTPRQMSRMNAVFKKRFGVHLNQHIRFRPMFIMSLLFQKMLGEETHVSLDNWIWKTAKMHGKVTGGIETIEEQVRIMRQLSIELEYKQLWKMCKNISQARRHLFKLSELYLKEDIVSLLKRTKRSLGANKQLLLTDRNRLMAERIEIFHDKQASLFTFGAGHLAGQNGVLNLLKKRGFKVKSKF